MLFVFWAADSSVIFPQFSHQISPCKNQCDLSVLSGSYGRGCKHGNAALAFRELITLGAAFRSVFGLPKGHFHVDETLIRLTPL